MLLPQSCSHIFLKPWEVPRIFLVHDLDKAPMYRRKADRAATKVRVQRTAVSIFYFHSPHGTKCLLVAALQNLRAQPIWHQRCKLSPRKQFRAAALFMPWGDENLTKICNAVLLYTNFRSTLSGIWWIRANQLVQIVHLENSGFLKIALKIYMNNLWSI